MRLIGHLPSETSASLFSDFLYVQGIHNQVEHETDGWAVWIHSEDELEKAKELLDTYKTNPADAKFQKHSRRASELKAREVKEDEEARKRYFDSTRVFKSTVPYGLGALTLLLIGLSIVLTTFSWTEGEEKNLFRSLLVTERFEPRRGLERIEHGLPEIRNGQVWRLVSSVFLHGGARPSGIGLMHLVFNMWWLLDLGSMIESRKSSRLLLVQVLVIGTLSSLAQWYVTGFGGIGMSGVVYGLFGYVWMKSKYGPAEGLFLHPQNVMMMMVWFVACWTVIPNIANWAHTAGLVLGVLWGVLSSRRRPRE